MPYASRLLVRVSCCIAIAALSACASKPEPRVVPLKRAMEIPISSSAEMRIFASQGTYRYQSYAALPEAGTRESTPPAPRSAFRRHFGPPPLTAEGFARDMERLFGPYVVIPALGVALVVGTVDAATGGPQNRKEERESNLQMTAPLQEFVLDAVVRQGLNDALAQGFKATLGWTRPNLTVPAPLVDWSGPEAKWVHTVNLPAFEIFVTRIELLELSRSSRTLLLCAKTWVSGGTNLRVFDSCRQEPWDTAFFSKDSDREAFIGSLAAATTRLGEAMARDVIRE